MDNTDKTQSNDAATGKTDNKTTGGGGGGANKANAGQQTQGDNKDAAQSGKGGGAAAASSGDVSGGGAAQTGTSNASSGGAVSDATSAVKDALGQAKETGSAVASQAYGIAAQKATEAIDEHKTNLTQGLTSVADTIRQIGGNLSGAQEPTGVANIAAQYTNTAAEKVEQISGYLDRRDFKGLIRDLEDVAHRNPAIFLGGAFALGILAARFLKSGNPDNAVTRRRHSSSDSNRSGGGGDTNGGIQVKQLRRKDTGRADTLHTSDTAATRLNDSENMGG